MEKALEIRVRGIVQGVGFRPFVYKLAKKHNLKGFVLNDTEGVKIEVSGLSGNIEKFLSEIRKTPPPLSEITSIESKKVAQKKFESFSIVESLKGKNIKTLISPDISTCKECLEDISDTDNRRHLYPFTNCTNCGPRFTIIEKIPYDRPNTTMKNFKMCEDCFKEYHDPGDRRFHAQPNACPVCGPKLKLMNSQFDEIKTKNPLPGTIEYLKAGKLIAIKSLGGFHISCDAENNASVQKLRAKKGREEKPLAIMVADIATAEKIAEITLKERKLLESPERPIVILKKKKGHRIANSVAPGNSYFGIMLPYTPLHHLLFFYDTKKKTVKKKGSNFRALVMTSANITEEPIVINDDEAKERISETVNYVLSNDREIHTRTDDSVVRTVGDASLFIRRARGFAPAPIYSRQNFREILALGAELKNTVCISKENNLFLSQHIGDLKNLENFEFFKNSINHLKETLKIDPETVAFDMHPDYLNSKYALKERFLSRIAVQHHHAHMASCMLDNNLEAPCVAIIADGTGYGIDGTIWGGEILVGDTGSFERKAHLRTVPMPGGDAAVKEPYRMTFAFLHAAYGQYWEDLDLDFIYRIGFDRLKFLEKMVTSQVNSPMTSSLGRMFDAVSSLLGIKDVNTYEGQAAAELEMAMKNSTKETYPYTRYKEGDKYVINTVPIIDCIVDDLKKNRKKIIPAKFHNTVIKFLVGAAHRVAKDYKIKDVVLSGGCFQNPYLLKGMMTRLKRKGLKPYSHRNIPTNDAGISVGQAAVANIISKERI